jgi:hypothetical protein
MIMFEKIQIFFEIQNYVFLEDIVIDFIDFKIINLKKNVFYIKVILNNYIYMKLKVIK